MKNKIKKRKLHEPSFFRAVLVLTLIALLGLSIYSFIPSLSKPLLGPHSFRQTQNAISSYYSVKENAPVWMNVMPVCGPPWNLPTEFPLFQYMVGRLNKFTGLPLDLTGRFLSLSFFFLSLVPVVLLLRSKEINFSYKQWIPTLLLIISSPVYLFWGSAYLMETTALCLSLFYVVGSLKTIDIFNNNTYVVNNKFQRPKIFGFISCLLFSLTVGILCAMQKGTTWVSAAGVLVLIVCWKNVREPKQVWLKDGLLLTIFCGIPLICAKAWISYGDSLKSLNPFARELFVVSSANHNRWNYGTLEQKLDPETWLQIFQHVNDQILVAFPVVGSFFMPAILIFGGFCSPQRLPLIVIFLAGFFSGPIIFTNLYFEHSYYWCANAIWFLLALGTAIAGIVEWKPNRQWKHKLGFFLALSVAASGYLSWKSKFLPVTLGLPDYEKLAEVWIKPVQDSVPPDRTILILGNDWNPNSLYYAERKGIAFPTADWIPLPGPQLEESLKNLGPDEKLGAVVVNEQLLNAANQAFFTDFLNRLGMSQNGKRTAFGILFPAADLTAPN
jgi:hypothetical protein